MLILLNGPPASGKSTLAAHFVDRHPMALSLDLDVVRGLLGRWLDQPVEAGTATRALASAMAATHLAAGYDVIVPQFLARPGYIEELAAIAAAVDTGFVELALIMTRHDAIAAFEDRRVSPENSTHRDAAALVGQDHTTDPIGTRYDMFKAMLDHRPSVKRIDVVRGDVAATMQRLELAIVADG